MAAISSTGRILLSLERIPAFPHAAIIVVHRSDGRGTTCILDSPQRARLALEELGILMTIVKNIEADRSIGYRDA